MSKKTTSVSPPESLETQLRKAWTHIKGQFWGGTGIGLVIFFVVQIAQNQSFAKSCVDLFTDVHPILFVTGLVGMFTYMLARGHENFFVKICQTWFDFIQQFLTLGLGAFFPIKLGVIVAGMKFPQLTTLNFSDELLRFSLFALGAFLFGTVWALREEKFEYPKVTVWVCGASIIFGLFVIIHMPSLAPDGSWKTLFTGMHRVQS